MGYAVGFIPANSATLFFPSEAVVWLWTLLEYQFPSTKKGFAEIDKRIVFRLSFPTSVYSQNGLIGHFV